MTAGSAARTIPPRASADAASDADAILARLDAHETSATLPPGALNLGKKDLATPAAAGASPGAPPQIVDLLLAIQRDLKDLRKGHQDLAEAVEKMREASVRSAVTSAPIASAAVSGATKAAPASQRKKSVLLVDDDAASRQAAAKTLEGAGFELAQAESGRVAMAAMAREKPSVVIVEGAMAGELSGRDFVNYVKASMEWIDIPILLHTRETIANHEIARTEYGADDFVLKGEGSADALAKKALRLTS